jgi:hypothetical protein
MKELHGVHHVINILNELKRFLKRRRSVITVF